MACEFPYRCGRLDCELLYPYALVLYFALQHVVYNYIPCLCVCHSSGGFSLFCILGNFTLTRCVQDKVTLNCGKIYL